MDTETYLYGESIYTNSHIIDVVIKYKQAKNK